VRKRIRDLQANVNRSTINTNRLSTTKPNRLTTNDQTEINDQNPLTDQRMQQLSDMLDKLTNAISQCEKSDEELTNEIELTNEDDLDEAEKEYNRLVPEYNALIDYLKNISEKFSILEQEFNEEQNNEKAKKIVDEFLQCENEDGFLRKRQRVVQLHLKLKHLQKIFEKNSDFSEDEH
jgi:predicted S18 family serine protease